MSTSIKSSATTRIRPNGVTRSARAISIKDVAARAGVSTATVSVAMNRGHLLRESTRDRVLKVAEELGYVANAQARAMRAGPADAIGFLVAQSIVEHDPAFMGVVARHLLEAASNERFCLMSETLHVDAGQVRMPRIVGQRRIMGLLLLGEASDDTLAQMAAWGLPICRLGLEAPQIEGCSAVALDMRQGMADAVQYLASLGHRRIGAVLGVSATQGVSSKKCGYVNQMKDLHLPTRKEWLVEVPVEKHNFAGAYEATQKMLSQPQAPTAVLFEDDWYAMGGIKAAEVMGIHVPNQLSIVGHDNSFLAAESVPGITSIELDFTTLARTAVDMLVRSLQGRSMESTIWIRPSLYRRNSCARCCQEGSPTPTA